MTNMDHQLYRLVSEELQSGEKIEWMGQPQPGGYAMGSLKIFFFAIPWTLFSLFWIAAAAEFSVPDFQEVSDFFPLLGLPFLLIGLGLLTRPLADYFKAYKIVYVITTMRIVIIQFGSRKKIRSYPLTGIGAVNRVEKKDGSGDLYFSLVPLGGANHSRFSRVGFKAISQVKRAESYLQVKEKSL